MILSRLKHYLAITWVAFRRLGERRITLILSFTIGILSGIAGVILKSTLHWLRTQIGNVVPMDTTSLLFFGLPTIGILLTLIFVRYFVKDDISHGVTRVLYSISREGGRIKPHNMFSSIIGSVLTIGFGGSVGAEAPVVYTGSAIGSNVGNFFRLNFRTRTLLIGCGAAGAIASIFKAPIAGIVFTLEVLMLDLTTASIVPLLIAAAAASSVSYFLMGPEVVFDYEVVRPFVLQHIPWYLLLGIFCGLVSLYFTRTVYGIEKRFKGYTRSPYKKWVVGSAILGILIFLFPPLFGEGYDVLQALLDGNPGYIFHNSPFYEFQNSYWLLVSSLLLIIALKAVATAVTNGAGGVGGIFAPSLFIGGIAGFLVANVINRLGIANVSESNFALVGMAGTMAGVMHAPFMAIFLIAEITGGYKLFVPLMLTSTIAYLTILYFEPHSIYTKRLAQRGELITHHKDKAVLTLLSVGKVIETEFTPIKPTDTLGVLIKHVSQSRRNIFPVLEEGKLVGVVSLDDIRPIMFDAEQYERVTVQEIMSLPPEVISISEPMESVLNKFEESKAWNLPVTDGEKYVGFISKSKIFSVYRNLLIEFSEE